MINILQILVDSFFFSILNHFIITIRLIITINIETQFKQTILKFKIQFRQFQNFYLTQFRLLHSNNQ